MKTIRNAYRIFSKKFYFRFTKKSLLKKELQRKLKRTLNVDVKTKSGNVSFVSIESSLYKNGERLAKNAKQT